tara:strand:- start:220 stop:483 length:264 start_codon:yes stop_codon:yes gene_type:complete
MEDFGTFECKGFDGHRRTWRVYADINEQTQEIDFIRLQYGSGVLPGPALRPSECHQAHEIKALQHVRGHVAAGHIEDDFDVIDSEDA